MCRGANFLLLLLLWLPFSFLTAQQKSLYDYQNLSHFFYEKQKDSIKKAWVCPTIYKEKVTQKKYKEFWDARTDFFLEMITADNYVFDHELLLYVNDIVNQIVKANKPLLPQQPFVLIDRSPSVNAYAMGGNVIAINLGLLSFVQSREELSLVIAHELSHNILEHSENAMKQKAEWFSSDDYKNSVNAVLDSKYERLSRLKKVLEGFSFSRSKHQRYHEGDADSLAIVLLRKSNIGVEPRLFLRLDSSDMQYKRALKNPLPTYFSAYNLSFEEAWTQKRSRGLSTRTYSFRDTSGISDSLKTHPDCIDRYTKNKSAATTAFSMVPAAIQQKASKMILWNMYCNMQLTPCLYRILQEKDKGNTDEWYDFMLYAVFTGLYHADQELHRFNAIGVKPKEYISKDYYELQTALEQIPRPAMEQYCRTLQSANFWSKMTRNETGLKNFLHTLVFDPASSDKSRAAAAKDFAAAYPTSLYLEFVSPFEKK